MKKILSMLLILSAISTITGCGNKENNDSDNSMQNNQEKETINLSNVQTKIEEFGITCEKTETMYEMVGAKDGFKLKCNDKRIEIYQFDKKSDAYKDAEKNQKLNVSSMNIQQDATVKNGYAYIIDKDFEKHDDIIKILDKLN